MALYTYQALSKDGKKVLGKVDASSNADAREQITKMGLYPVKIESVLSAKPAWSFRDLFKRNIDIKEKIFFTKQLAMLLKSGVPLLQTLELLADQTEGTLKTIVISLKDHIKAGLSLAEALEKFPKTFDNTYVQLIKAGEASGKLDVILNRLTTFLEKRNEITRRVKGALSYPLFQLGFIFVIVGGLFTFLFYPPNCRNINSKRNSIALADALSACPVQHRHQLLLAHFSLSLLRSILFSGGGKEQTRALKHLMQSN